MTCLLGLSLNLIPSDDFLFLCVIIDGCIRLRKKLGFMNGYHATALRKYREKNSRDSKRCRASFDFAASAATSQTWAPDAREQILALILVLAIELRFLGVWLDCA